MNTIIQNYPSNIKVYIEYKILDSNIKKNILNELKELDFISNELANMLNVSKYIEFSYKNISLNTIPVNYISNDIITTVIKRIYTLVKIYSITYPLRIWFIPIKSKRRFPVKGEIVDSKHINGGYTYLHNHNIFVYRYEDFEKVILHEVLHNSILQIPWADKNISELRELFKINNKSSFQPTEAFIEFWAIYYHVRFIAYETGKSFSNLLEKEILWNLYLTRKLLKYQKKYFEEKGWYEYTNSFSYIIIKTILLCNWRKILNMKEYTSDNINKLIRNVYKGSNKIYELYPKYKYYPDNNSMKLSINIS
jgi:hypothetical protein